MAIVSFDDSCALWFPASDGFFLPAATASGLVSMTSDRRDDMAKVIVDYARVSTEGQGKTGASLERQKQAIRAFAYELKLPVLEIFEDIETAAGASNVDARMGPQNALKACRDHDGLLVVWDWSRLSRHTKSTAVLRSLVPAPDRIHSLKQAEDLRAASERARIVHAEAERDAISKATREGMTRKKAEGVEFGNPDIRSIQRSGTQAASEKAEEVVRFIIDYLRTPPDPMNVTRQIVADHLNASGRRTGQGQSWNVERVTRPLREARKRLATETNADLGELTKNPLFGLF